MIIDPTDKNRVKEKFSVWLENKDQISQINDHNKEVVKETAEILNVKTKTINKLFNFLKQKYNGGEDELDTLIEIASSLES